MLKENTNMTSDHILKYI